MHQGTNGHAPSNADHSGKHRTGLKTAVSKLAAKLHLGSGGNSPRAKRSNKEIHTPPSTPTSKEELKNLPLLTSNPNEGGMKAVQSSGNSTNSSAVNPLPPAKEDAPQIASPGWIMGPVQDQSINSGTVTENDVPQSLVRIDRTDTPSPSPPPPVPVFLPAGPFAAAQELSVHMPENEYRASNEIPNAKGSAESAVRLPAGPFAGFQETSVLYPVNLDDVQQKPKYRRTSIEKSVESQEVLVDELARYVPSNAGGTTAQKVQKIEPENAPLLNVRPPPRPYDADAKDAGPSPLAALQLAKKGDEEASGLLEEQHTDAGPHPGFMSRHSIENPAHRPVASSPDVVMQTTSFQEDTKLGGSGTRNENPENENTREEYVTSPLGPPESVAMPRVEVPESMVVPPIDEPLRLGALGWVMHRPLTGLVFLVFGIAALRMIWDRMPDALRDLKPALLLSGAVALMATVMACVIGGTSLLPLPVTEGEMLRFESTPKGAPDPTHTPSEPVSGARFEDLVLGDPAADDPGTHGPSKGGIIDTVEEFTHDAVENVMTALDPGEEMVGDVYQETESVQEVRPSTNALWNWIAGAARTAMWYAQRAFEILSRQATRQTNAEKEGGYSTDADVPGPVLQGVHTAKEGPTAH